MKGLRVLLFLASALLNFPAPAPALEINKNWQMDVLSQFEFGLNSVRGSGKPNSSLYRRKGGYYADEALDVLNRFTFDDLIYEFDVQSRFTNNKQYDPEAASLKKIYFKRESPYSLFQAGDFLATARGASAFLANPFIIIFPPSKLDLSKKTVSLSPNAPTSILLIKILVICGLSCVFPNTHHFACA